MSHSSSNALEKGLVFVSRIESFSASHRLHSNALSLKENQEVFGKCNHINGHGHNYKVTVTVAGIPDAKSGMVINLVDLKKCIQDTVIKNLDHRNIASIAYLKRRKKLQFQAFRKTKRLPDIDVDYFGNGARASTAENIVVYAWNLLEKELKKYSSTVRMHCVELYETDSNKVAYYG